MATRRQLRADGAERAAHRPRDGCCPHRARSPEAGEEPARSAGQRPHRPRRSRTISTRDFIASGALIADAAVRGSFDAPQITGRMQVQNAALNVVDFPNGISNANGTILFSGDRATIEKLSGRNGRRQSRHLRASSAIRATTSFSICRRRADQVRVRYPEGVSTVANARLRLTGTSDRSTLAGTITILRTGFNPQSDFSSIIAQVGRAGANARRRARACWAASTSTCRSRPRPTFSSRAR